MLAVLGRVHRQLGRLELGDEALETRVELECEQEVKDVQRPGHK